MKLKIEIYNEVGGNYIQGTDGPYAVALEPSCTSLIINGVQLIREGELQQDLAALMRTTSPTEQLTQSIFDSDNLLENQS